MLSMEYKELGLCNPHKPNNEGQYMSSDPPQLTLEYLWLK